MIRPILFATLVFVCSGQCGAQWEAGGLFSTFNHFQACAFHTPDSGLFAYGADNPASGEGGIIRTDNGLSSGGFYIWYESFVCIEDIDVQVIDGFPYYMAAGHQQYNRSIILKQELAFGSQYQFDSVRTAQGQYYRAVRMRSDLVAFAGGANGLNDGVIDMSLDTGATWTNVALLPGQPVSRLHFVNDQLAFASTGGYRRLSNNGVLLPDSGAIYRSTNGGLEWLQVHADPFEGFSDVAFSTTTIGVATRNDGVIMRTTNGGDSWAPANVDLVEALVMTSVTFRQDGLGFASGYRTDGSGGYILISTDGGANWTLNFSTVLLNHSRRIYDLYFHDPAHGYASTHIRPLRTSGLITGIDDLESRQFELFPNPALDEVVIRSVVGGEKQVNIHDAMGRLVMHRLWRDDQLTVPLFDLATGSYWVQVTTGDGVFSQLLLVQ